MISFSFSFFPTVIVRHPQIFDLSMIYHVAIDQDTRSPKAQEEMLDLWRDLQNATNPETEITFWFHLFKLWINYKSPYSAEYAKNGEVIPEDKFFDWLTDFLRKDGRCLQGDLILDHSSKQINASRMLILEKTASVSTGYIESITSAEKISHNSPLDSYVLSPPFPCHSFLQLIFLF